MASLEASPHYIIYFDNVRVDEFVKSWTVNLSCNGNIGTAEIEFVYLAELAYTAASVKDIHNSESIMRMLGVIDNMTNVKIFVKNIFSQKYQLIFDGNIKGKSSSRSPRGSSLVFRAVDYMAWTNRTIAPIVIPYTQSTHPKLLKKVEKSKQMSEEEKRSMIANINQATGQTQDMVSGALEVVTALGGRGAREKMLDGITIDTATKVKTGASKFDDFTNKKVLSKLSLDDQQRIQELAVDHAVKQVEKQFGNNLNGLGELIQQKGYAEGNEKIQSILEGGVTKGEVKSLVKELMTVAQGGSGKSEVDKILGDVTENAAKNTKAANKNLDKANKNMEDMTNKLDEFTNTVNKAIKNLDKRTNQLETTMNRF